jgi:hypothetical protein
VTQLRQVETALQVREQRAVARLAPVRKPRKPRKAAAKTRRTADAPATAAQRRRAPRRRR